MAYPECSPAPRGRFRRAKMNRDGCRLLTRLGNPGARGVLAIDTWRNVRLAYLSTGWSSRSVAKVFRDGPALSSSNPVRSAFRHAREHRQAHGEGADQRKAGLAYRIRHLADRRRAARRARAGGG